MVALTNSWCSTRGKAARILETVSAGGTMLDLNMGTEAFVHRAVRRRGIGSGKGWEHKCQKRWILWERSLLCR
jgi:hypothetical protein